MIRKASFSSCGTYRYALWRAWDFKKPQVMIVGLNPSTADHSKDDPTIRRCMSFAQRWGFGKLVVTNLFAFKATHPEDLKAANDPVGPLNNKWLTRAARESDLVVAAWGNHGIFNGRASEVTALLPGMYCLKMNKSGQPAHPLYLRSDEKPGKMCV